MTDVVVAAGGAEWERQLLRDIERAPELALVRRCVDAADLLAMARTASAAWAFVAVDLTGLDLWVVDEMTSAGVRVIGIGDDTEHAASIGIAEVVAAGDAVKVGPVAPARTVERQASTGKVWAVWGTPGAPGTSSVALSLASAVARTGHSTVLIDADTRSGSLAQQLAVLDDASGVLGACRAAVRGRVDDVESHLLEVEPKLRILTGVPRPDGWQHIRTIALQRVVERIAATSDVTVIDCGSSSEISGPGPIAHVVSTASEVVVVGRCDPVGLSRLVRSIELLRDSVDVRHQIVLNQLRSTLGWREAEVSSTLRRLLGREPDLFLPWDQEAMDRALISGRSPYEVAPKSPFVTRIDVLARRLQSGAHW